MEGSPVQELNALAIDTKSNIILDAFHDYGDHNDSDKFARVHIHGLVKTSYGIIALDPNQD